MKRFILIAALASLVGCQAAPPESTGTARAAAALGAGHEGCEHAGTPARAESCGGEKGAHESCGACGGEAAGQPVPDDAVTGADPVTGAAMTSVGAKLGALAAVKVTDLLARPGDFAGKMVRLEGNVSAMCGHRRAWFAVQAEDRSGQAVRVVTAPAFLVPPGTVGKRARTEGLVEVAQPAGGGPARITVRATGAEFL
jgi:hypothetical protein